MNPLVVAWVFWAATGQALSVSSAPADLASARALYAAGNYEDALSKLPANAGDEMIGEVDEYRALCQLALGRSADAQHSLEDLVTRQPLFQMSEADLSPRLVSMFRDTRTRLLPALIRTRYARAKSDYDQKAYAQASGEFKDLLGILADAQLLAADATLTDLKTLADGFVTLADAEVAAAAKAAAPPPAPAPPPSPTTAPAEPLYTEDDTTVQPPVAVAMAYPPWHAPAGAAANQTYRGVLRIVVDTTGHVESATIQIPISASYDPLLLAATQTWTFKPAVRNGVPVKFVKVIAVSLSAR